MTSCWPLEKTWKRSQSLVRYVYCRSEFTCKTPFILSSVVLLTFTCAIPYRKIEIATLFDSILFDNYSLFQLCTEGSMMFLRHYLHFVGYSWFHCQPIISALYGGGSPNGGKRYCTYLKLDPQSPTKFYQCAYDLCLHASLLTCNFDLNLKLI